LPEEEEKAERNFPSQMKKSLTKKEIIRKQTDLKKIFASGAVSKCRGAKILFLQNSLPYNRFAVTLVRKYGNSIERNYSKRILREIYRTEKDSLKISYDIVIVLYPGDYSFRDRYEQYKILVKRANLV
jgi:ribonuclease P protein component